MQKKEVTVIAVLPIGPDNDSLDTIESIFLYTRESVHILAIDDSNNIETKGRMESMDPRITVLKSIGHGVRGGLWINLAQAYKFAVENFNFKVLFRIDTDALVIAYGLDDDAIKTFEENPHLGMIGSYRIDCNGDKRSFWTASNGIRREAGIRGFVNPKRRSLFRSWLKLAKQNGYEMGEHCIGGANFQSYECVKSMKNAGFLDTQLSFLKSEVSEDFIFSLLTVACGYKLADFATGDLPMGLRWKGLPDSPENLIKRKKKVIHSIKFWKDMDQASIRAFFAKERAKDKGSK